MESCQFAVEQMEGAEDLDSLATLEKVMEQLPYAFLEKWAKKVDRLTRRGGKRSLKN